MSHPVSVPRVPPPQGAQVGRGSGWSWRLGTFAGIGVWVHASFALLIAWVVYGEMSGGASAIETIGTVVFVLLLFGCVVLHEYGHALTARHYGIRTRDITLYPIGGVARLEKMPDRPIEEFWVAVAGPAVNVVIAALLFILLLLSGGLIPLSQIEVMQGSILNRLMLVNITLVLFNLLPAFPMDGGRVLRALLGMRMEHTRATQIAAVVGKSMALLFGIAGMFFNPFLLFIAIFVWAGADQEQKMTQTRSALAGIPVHRAMVTHFTTLAPDDSLDSAVRELLAGSQQEFPVVYGGDVVGILRRADLLAGLKASQPLAVRDVMKGDFAVAGPMDLLEGALLRLQTSGLGTMPVLDRGRLIGILTSENLGEFMMVRQALAGSQRPAPTGSY